MQFTYLKHDLNRWFYPNDGVRSTGLLAKIGIVVTTQGVWSVIAYRFTRWIDFECRSILARRIFKIVAVPIAHLVQTLTGICIMSSTDIGPGLYIGHFGGIFTAGNVKIGKFCNLSQENAIGWGGRGDNRGVPEIGDFVYIGPGAKIFGKIRIGNHAAIGANAVVTKDVPDHAVAVGVPARVINFNSSLDFIEFNREKSREVLGGW